MSRKEDGERGAGGGLEVRMKTGNQALFVCVCVSCLEAGASRLEAKEYLFCLEAKDYLLQGARNEGRNEDVGTGGWGVSFFLRA